MLALSFLLVGVVASVPLSPPVSTTLSLGDQRDLALGNGMSRDFTFTAPDAQPFTASCTMVNGDVSLRVCNTQSSQCRTVDGASVFSTEVLTVDSVSDPVFGGANTVYTITVLALPFKQSSPVSIARFSLTLTSGSSALALSPSPSVFPPFTAVFPDTTVTTTTSGGVSFFRFTPTLATAMTFTAYSITGGELELSFNTVLPSGAGESWSAFASGLSASAAAPSLLFAQPTDNFFLGNERNAFYVVRVASTAASGEVTFSLRVEHTPTQQLPSPTPTPSPSAAPLSPASTLLSPEPLYLDAHPLRDSLGLGSTRQFTFIATSPDAFTVVADNSMGGGSGDVSLRVCGETACLDMDGTFASRQEMITVSPGSSLYGGQGASYTISITALSAKQTTPQVANYVVYVSTSDAGAASPSPAPAPPSILTYEVYRDTSVTDSVGGGDPSVRFFMLRAGSFSEGITATITVTNSVDVEISLGTAAPWGEGLSTTEWRPYLLASSNVGGGGSATATLGVAPGSIAYMGVGALATYYVRVRSKTASNAQFLLRISSDPSPAENGIAASPTPTPSPSAAPLSPASAMLSPEPLYLDAHPLRDSLGLAGVRQFTYLATSPAPFTVVADNSMGGGSGDVSLRVCGELRCIDRDSTYASAQEMITVSPGSVLWGGLGATYTISITALSAKQTTPQVANYVLYVSTSDAGAASPSPSPQPPSILTYEVYRDTSVTDSVGGGDPSVRFFMLRAGSFSGGITATLTVTNNVDAEISLGTAAPWGAGLFPTEWRPYLVASSNVGGGGSATATLGVAPGSIAYMGVGALATYYVRVRSKTASNAQFLLRISSDPSPAENGIAASPTPTPSPSAAPLSPASTLLSPEPLYLDAHPLRDSLGLAGVRQFTYLATSPAPFSVVADNSLTGGSGDVSLRVCGETTCLDKDSTYAGTQEMITVSPGSVLWGGLGATYTISITALSAKQTTPSVANYVVYVSSSDAGAASPSPAPVPASTVSYNLFFDTSVTEVVGGVGAGDAAVRFFVLRPGIFSGGFTTTLTATGAVDVEVSLGTAAPWGAGISTTEWRPYLVGSTNVGGGGSATVALGVAPGSIAYMGVGAQAAYHVRVRSKSGDAAAIAPFLLRASTYATPPPDFATPATPTPTPSPSPSAPSSLLSNPVFQALPPSTDFADALGVGSNRFFTYQHALNTPFIIYIQRGSGDPVLTVCGSDVEEGVWTGVGGCFTADSTYSSSDESVRVAPGSPLWGGMGATYRIRLFNSPSKITTPEVMSYIVGAYTNDLAPVAAPTPTPGPWGPSQQVFEGTDVSQSVGAGGEDWFFFTTPSASAPGPWAFRVTNSAPTGFLALDLGLIPRPGIGGVAPSWVSYTRAYAATQGAVGEVTLDAGDAWYLPPTAGTQRFRTVHLRITGTPGTSYTLQAVLTAPSATPSTTLSASATRTPTMTPAPFVSTPTPSGTPVSASRTSAPTPSTSGSSSTTPSVTPTSTDSPTPTPTLPAGLSPSITPSASATVSDSSTSTASRAPTPSTTPSWSSTGTPTSSPTASLTVGGIPSVSPTVSLTVSDSATLTASPTPSSTVTLSATSTPSSSPSPTATLSKGASPSITPSGSPTSSPSNSPTPTPTGTKGGLNDPSKNNGSGSSGSGSGGLVISDGVVAAAVVVPLLVLGIAAWVLIVRRRRAQGKGGRQQGGAGDVEAVIHNPMGMPSPASRGASARGEGLYGGSTAVTEVVTW